MPTHVEAGNNFGTEEYFPFFIADVHEVVYALCLGATVGWYRWRPEGGEASALRSTGWDSSGARKVPLALADIFHVEPGASMSPAQQASRKSS